MSADEEYLDNLLKLMEGDPAQQEADLLSFIQNQDTSEGNQTSSENEKDNGTEENSDVLLDDILAASDTSEEVVDEEKDDLSDLLDSLNEEIGEKTVRENEDSASDLGTSSETWGDLDVTKLIDGMDSTDADLSEINDLLKMSDNNENIEASADTSGGEDVFALLESMKTEGESDSEIAEDDSKEEKKKGLSFGKKKSKEKKEPKEKKKKEKKKKEKKGEEQDISIEDVTVEEVKKEDKPHGFLGRLFEELVREEEEPQEEEKNGGDSDAGESESGGNAGKKKGKKEKKKKEKKNKKGKKGDPVSAEEDSEETEDTKKKKKKPRKEKKKKEKPEESNVPKEKPVKVLSKKALFSLIALCATLIAAIILLSIFLTDYADIRNARNAFYAGNYEEVYELLYDKNRNQSDELLFNRANIVLMLQRRLDSYELNKKTGKEPEALDALLQGVSRYAELSSGETYGAVDELQALYQQILSRLDEDYGISEGEALEINTYDSETYSQKVYLIINGGDAFASPEEKETAAAPADILPEEEDIIQIEQ